MNRVIFLFIVMSIFWSGLIEASPRSVVHFANKADVSLSDGAVRYAEVEKDSSGFMNFYVDYHGQKKPLFDQGVRLGFGEKFGSVVALNSFKNLYTVRKKNA